MLFESSFLSGHTGLHTHDIGNAFRIDRIRPGMWEFVIIQEDAEFASVDFGKVKKPVRIFGINIEQEMSSMGNQPAAGQVNQAYVVRLGIRHQI